MRSKQLFLLWAPVVVVAGCQVAREASTPRPQANPATAPAVAAPSAGVPAPTPAAEDSEHLLALGKELFVARCSSCHNERGDKPLASGPPLNQRDVSAEDIIRNVNGRFKNATDEQRRAVVLYMQSFLKTREAP